jgi:hypothetical protein
MMEIFAIEFRIAADHAAGVDERHTSPERGAGCIGERIGVEAGPPLGRDQPRFALQLSSRFFGETIAQATPGDRDDAAHEDEDQHQRSGEESLGERHAPRAWPLFKRYPNPRTVSIRSPDSPSLVRSR